MYLIARVLAPWTSDSVQGVLCHWLRAGLFLVLIPVAAQGLSRQGKWASTDLKSQLRLGTMGAEGFMCSIGHTIHVVGL